MRNINSSRAVIGEAGLTKNYGDEAILHFQRRSVGGDIGYRVKCAAFILRPMGPRKPILIKDGQILEIKHPSGWRTYQVRYPSTS